MLNAAATPGLVSASASAAGVFVVAVFVVAVFVVVAVVVDDHAIALRQTPSRHHRTRNLLMAMIRDVISSDEEMYGTIEAIAMGWGGGILPCQSTNHNDPLR